MPKAGRGALLFIFILVLTDSIGFGIILPVLPRLIMQLTGVGIDRAARYGGGLSFVYALMQFFCAPVLGNLSDRFGREIVWSLSCLGFAVCYVALLLLAESPSQPLLWLMVLSQGALGYAVATIMGPIVAEIFEGPRFGSIFSLLMVALIGGGAAGPFFTGLLHDWTGTYSIAFWLGVFFSVVCAVAVWIAAPRKVRRVARSLG